MIAAWMLYCIAIGFALTVVGVALERGLHLAGRPTRWAWIIALAGSFAIPAAAWLRPEAFSTMAVPVPTVPVAEATSIVAPVPAEAPQAFSLRDLDAALRWGWAVSSMLLLGVLGTAALRLAALRRRWRAASVDGRTVLVSENVGPAVAGLWRPDVIVPGWALALGEPQRRLMLSHEEEHVRAADPWLLAIGAAALVLMPWNPALWWQVRRLRLAVEVDCDTRVLAAGGTTPEYGELLLQVGHRRTQFALATPALGEPVSFLERRIHRMVTALPRWRWAGATTAAIIAAGAVFGACETPRPMEADRVPDRVVAPNAAAIGQRVREHVDSVVAEAMRARARQNLERYYPDLLREQSGPPVDVWFGHDPRTGVTQAIRTKGGSGDVTTDRILAVFPTFRPMYNGWGVVSRRALTGLVRDNVRVILVNLEGGGGTVLDSAPAAQAPAAYRGPILSWSPAPVYPALLRRAGIRGRVIVQAIINETGRADPASVKIVESPHPGFNQAATDWVLAARFDPARAQGRAVRSLVQLPIEFGIE